MNGRLASYFALTKPGVVILLQITGICSVMAHDLLEAGGLSGNTARTIAVVLIGGYLTAGGANSINMWYDRDIDPLMTRTANRPIPAGEIKPLSALLFGILMSLIGTLWLYVMANPVAAFWASFSVMFYVFVYSIWLKRTSPQNIVIGGIAGSTPPLVGWSASEQSLEISTDSLQSMFESVTEIGSMMPWLMFFVIFLWTPPHFWALALYKSKEYGEVGVPMMPNVKGKSRTMLEMKIYSVALMVVSLYAPIANGHLVDNDTSFHVLRWSCFLLSGWYASTVWRIDINEGLDEKGRMPTAARSFFFSLYYLAMFFLLLVSSSWNLQISFIGVIICIGIIFRLESDAKSKERA